MKNKKSLYIIMLLSVFSITFNIFIVNAATYKFNDTNVQNGVIGTPAITLSFPLYTFENLSNTNADCVLFEIINDNGDLIYSGATDSKGVAQIGDIPSGTYYINIIDSLINLSEDKHYIFTLDDTTNTRIHFYYELSAIIGPALLLNNIRTYDGKSIPLAIYEITDKDGNIILRAITDEEGRFFIPADLFIFNEEYYLTLTTTIEEFSDYEMVTVPFSISKENMEIDIILYPKNFNYKKGDLNKDGVVNSNDAAMALDLYNNNNATTNDIDIGDIDGNNIINSTDAALILDIYTSGI